MKTWATMFLVTCSAVAALACEAKAPAAAAVAPTSGARAWPLFATQHPTERHAEAAAMLAQDAWRREVRFMNAADPGLLLRSTQVPQTQIDRGAWNSEQLYRIGGVLFNMAFTPETGFGAADLPALARFQRGRRGGPDTHSCADCHWRGGPAGAGDAADNAYFRGDGRAQDAGVVRNPPPLPGVGLVELVAAQMSARLQEQRDALLKFSAQAGYAVEDNLSANGVSFGALLVHPDGKLDFAKVRGVDDDLVIKPFGWKGTFSNVRDVVEDALLVHHGLQSQYLVAHNPAERIGSGPKHDPDMDGVTDEVTEGQVSAMTLFVAMQEVPVETLPTSPDLMLLYARGHNMFTDLGCAGCHTPALALDRADYVLEARNGAAASVRVDMLREAKMPRLAPDPARGTLELRLYSDLQRHHMGAAMADPRPDVGLPTDVFLTRPLWGLARSRPYMHDGRAPTIEDAILLHGGEAQQARDAFAALDEPGRAPLRVFLTSLTRAAQLTAP